MIPAVETGASVRSTGSNLTKNQHTLGHVHCPACDERLLAVTNPADLARRPFGEAAALWLNGHRLHISERTARDYGEWIAQLGKFFGALRLEEIHAGHIEQYQIARRTGTCGLGVRVAKDGVAKPAREAGAVVINHEIGVLVQILKRAGLWAPLEPTYRQVRERKRPIGRALTDVDEKRLFEVAAENPRWKVALYCSLLTANTTAGPSELRALRLRDLALAGDTPQMNIVEGTKNEFRVRSIPLNKAAAWAAGRLLERALEMGACEPGHYLLPHRAHTRGAKPDPTRPAGSWRKAWERLRQAAGMPHLRMYDLRHHAITRLLEQPEVSERTVTEIAGHVSKAMLDHYSHIRMSTKREAVAALDRLPVGELTHESKAAPGAPKKPPATVGTPAGDRAVLKQ